jgi:SAM-dependent methyltransferase
MTYSRNPDEEWFSKVSGISDDGRNEPLFALPPEQLQTGTVGRAGEAALRDAFMFWQFCRQQLIAEGTGLSTRHTKVLDFGVAWGRIIRFWLRDLRPENLYGVDVEERFLSFARTQVPGPNYALTSHGPPLPLEDESLDLVYAFSVFSHLPANLTDAWVREFARVLKPGGIACLTTRPRAHIQNAGTGADRSAQAQAYADIFKDRATALRAYDAGEFVYFASGGGGTLTPDKYGEAIIPLDYARKNWTSLEVLGLVENYSETFLQPCFVLRKR